MTDRFKSWVILMNVYKSWMNTINGFKFSMEAIKFSMRVLMMKITLQLFSNDSHTMRKRMSGQR